MGTIKELADGPILFDLSELDELPTSTVAIFFFLGQPAA